MILSPRIIIGLICVPVLALLLYKIYDHGVTVGAHDVQKKWDKRNAEVDKVISDQTNEIERLKREHTITIGEVTHDLAKAEKNFSVALATQRSTYEQRLQQSQSRSDYYKRQADSSPTECGNLGSIASQLDRSIVEGRQVVGELRATLEQRDAQVKALGVVVQSQYNLLKESD